jgi:hypothetical protein
MKQKSTTIVLTFISLCFLNVLSSCTKSDVDKDGFTIEEGDCNDENSNVYPGAIEICGDGVDQDCNGSDLDCNDVDNDHDSFTENQGDCDDDNKTVYPGAIEICGDEIDQDCDGEDLICFNIVPGERIGDFNIGENIATLLGKINPNALVNHFFLLLNDGSYIHLLSIESVGMSFFLVTNSSQLINSDKPESILAYEPFEGITETGITFGSLLSEVQDAYGAPDSVDEDGDLSYTAELGIAFWADDSGLDVEEIYIAFPGGRRSKLISKSIEKIMIEGIHTKLTSSSLIK